jgi:hypothetical protein
MPEKHTILGGKVHVYRRDNSSLWSKSSMLSQAQRTTILELSAKGVSKREIALVSSKW